MILFETVTNSVTVFLKNFILIKLWNKKISMRTFD